MESKIYGLTDIPLRFLHMIKSLMLFMKNIPNIQRILYFRIAKACSYPDHIKDTCGIKPVKIIYWRGAKQIRVPV